MNDHQESGESTTLKAGMGSTASSRSTFGPLQAPASEVTSESWSIRLWIWSYFCTMAFLEHHGLENPRIQDGEPCLMRHAVTDNYHRMNMRARSCMAIARFSLFLTGSSFVLRFFVVVTNCLF